MNKKIPKKKSPMEITRQKKRDMGLRPVEMWVHESVDRETIKGVEAILQKLRKS